MFEQPPSTQEDNAESVPLAPAAPLARIGDQKAQVRVHAQAMAGLVPAERLSYLRATLDGRIVFTHGFGVEGQVIFHWICQRELDIDVVTLDTGRLFPETHALWA